MGIANKVINILVLVAAIAAIVFGYMLFNKRTQIAESSSKMAEAIASNTNKMTPGAKISADDMALSKTTEDVEKAVGQLNKAVTETLGQRSEMAGVLADAATEMGITPDGKDKTNAQDMINRKVELKEVDTMIQSKIVREKVFVSGIKELGKIFKDPVSDSALSDDATAIGIYNDFIVKTAVKVDQNAAYIDGLDNLYKAMGIKAAAFDGDDFNVGLTKNQTAAMAFVEESKKNAIELEAVTAKLKSIEASITGDQNDIVRMVTERKKMEAEMLALKAENLRLRKIIDPNDTGDGLLSIERAVADFPFLRKIRGKVMFVNEAMGFVILDLGKTAPIKIEENGKLKDMMADVPADGIMTAASSMDPYSTNYTGRIQIVDIRENGTLANILPSNGKIPQIGDTVFFTEVDLNQMKKIREAKIAKIAAERAETIEVEIVDPSEDIIIEDLESEIDAELDAE